MPKHMKNAEESMPSNLHHQKVPYISQMFMNRLSAQMSGYPDGSMSLVIVSNHATHKVPDTTFFFGKVKSCKINP